MLDHACRCWQQQFNFSNATLPDGVFVHCAVQVLLSATEAAEMILRVDDIIRCAPRQRQG